MLIFIFLLRIVEVVILCRKIVKERHLRDGNEFWGLQLARPKYKAAKAEAIYRYSQLAAVAPRRLLRLWSETLWRLWAASTKLVNV